jgi:hypothetical protein
MQIGGGISMGGGLVAGSYPATSSSIITNGLILYLDGASYSGSGTAWNDLSGQSNNGTLVNNPSYTADPGYFTFNVVNNRYVSTSGTISSLSEATFIAWVNSSQTQEDYTSILMSRNGMGSATNYATGMNFASGGNNSIGYHWNDDGGTYGWDTGLAVPNNAWAMMAIRVSSTAATAYLGKSTGLTSSGQMRAHSAVSNPPLNFFISQDTGGGGTRNFKGAIAQILIYNRALTFTEINTTFNDTKTRYGL